MENENNLPRIDRSLIKKPEDIKTIVSELNANVKDLMEGDGFQRYLDFMAATQEFCFSRYSFRNQFLLLAQNPALSRVATFAHWKKFGRHVKKGEKSYKIIAPVAGKRKQLVPDRDPHGNILTAPDGSPLTHTEDVKCITGYQALSVFDISQTDGSPLPDPPIKKLLSKDAGEEATAKCLIQGIHLLHPNITYGPMPPGVNGSCEKDAIHIASGLPTLQAAKTLLHEYAHSLLEFGEGLGCEQDLPRPQKEMRAEAVAYTVCRHYGLDTSGYSLGYISSWGTNASPDSCTSLIHDITVSAQAVISRLDEAFEHTYILQQLKASHLRPEASLIDSMKQFNQHTRKVNSLQEIKDHYLASKQGSHPAAIQASGSKGGPQPSKAEPSAADTLAAKIIGECRQQQAARQPRPRIPQPES